MAKSFQQEPRDPKNTLLVDSLNIAFRWRHAGNDYDMPVSYPQTIKSLAKSYNCGQIILLGDGGSHWRKDLHPDYKTTRRKKHENDTEAEKQASEDFFAYYHQTMSECGLPYLKYHGVEADDLAAYIVENKCALDINDIWLISSDRDWDLLIEEDVSRFSTVTRKEITYDNWDYPVPMDKFIDFKTLVGDKGDDVPGVDGIGEKRAADLIEQYGSIFDLIGNLPLPGKAKYIDNLNNSEEKMYLSHQLMDLRSWCRDAIGDQLDKFNNDLAAIYGREIT